MKKIFLLVLLLVGFFYINVSKKEKDLQNLEILCFGDSITYGYGVNEDESYPAVLANLTNAKVQNSGLNGETSEFGLIRLKGILETSKFDVFILCHGGNDLLQNLNINFTKSNIKQMIKLAKDKNIKVLLIGVPNPSLGLFGLKSNEIYKEIANEENVPLENEILSEILINQNLKSDQIHPNKQGYEKLAKAIKEKLSKN